MKKIFIIFLSFYCLLNIFSRKISVGEAINIADVSYIMELNANYTRIEEWKKQKMVENIDNKKVYFIDIDNNLLMEDDPNAEIIAYVVKYQPKGFIIVSADDCTDPILTQGLWSDFSWKDVEENFLRYYIKEGHTKRMKEIKEEKGRGKSIKENENWKIYRSEIKKLMNVRNSKNEYKKIKYVNEQPLAYPGPDVNLGGSEEDINWNQGDIYGYYNNKVADIHRNKYPSVCDQIPAGCVATSMAIMMRYHCWPPQGTGSKSYEDDEGSIKLNHTANFNHAYNWEQMPKPNFVDENGYGPIERDMSNGGSDPNDGNPITLNGVTYTKGLGVHAPSRVGYYLNGSYKRFIADIGVDDEISDPNASVVFKVYANCELLFESQEMTWNSETINLNLDIQGMKYLRLIVDPLEFTDFDHADWADARLIDNNDNVYYISDLQWIGEEGNPLPPEIEDIVQLSYECGVAVGMDYEATGGSGSDLYRIPNSLMAFFGYIGNRYIYSYEPYIINSIRAYLPVPMSIPGHSIVAFGHREISPHYYINYGWGGSNTGWYNLGNIGGEEMIYSVPYIQPSNNIYVNWGYSGPETGEAQRPYNHIQEGLNNVENDGKIYMFSGSSGAYRTNCIGDTSTDRYTIRSCYGPAIIRSE